MRWEARCASSRHSPRRCWRPACSCTITSGRIDRDGSDTRSSGGTPVPGEGTDVMWRALLFVWIGAAIVAGFVWAPLVPILGDTTRVFYFHFPAALVTVIALGWSMVHSALYLKTRDLRHD